MDKPKDKETENFNKTVKILKKVIINVSAVAVVSSSILAGIHISNNVRKQNEDIKPTKEFTSTSEKNNDDDTDEEVVTYEEDTLQQIRQISMRLEELKYGNDGKYYNTADEQEVLEVCTLLKDAIKEYFKGYGASDWTNPDEKQFWPEDFEYIITAIAFRESSYRTNCINEKGCGGITGLNKQDTLSTIESWLTPYIWGENGPIQDINCNYDEVDVFNPVTCLEYTYYNMGYLLSNRFKKDKKFIDIDGQYRSVWDVLPYSEDTQVRLLVACHLYGMGNVVDAVFGRQAEGHPIDYYIHSNYVEDVLDKAYELQQTYNQGYQK